MSELDDDLRERGGVLLRDPLTETTRKERRALLGVSTVALAVALTGFVPEKIENFGITLTPGRRGALLWLMASVVVYFLSAFVAYAATDALAWRWEYHLAMQKLARETHDEAMRMVAMGLGEDDFDKNDPEIFRLERFRYRGAVGPVVVVRAVLDFAFPIVVGVAGVAALLIAARTA